MRVTRVILGSVAVLAIVAVLLIAVLLFLDLGFLSGRLESAAARVFDRRVNIEGLIRLKPSLWPTFVAEKVRIGNPDWASRPDLARVARLEVRVALLPLFSGELELLAVTLKGADLLLEVKSDDTNNFTVGGREGPRGLPGINTFSIQDSVVGYKTAEGKLHSCTIGKTKAQNIPERPVTLEGQVECKGLPLRFSLSGGTPEQFESPTAPWPMDLTVNVGTTSLVAKGNVSNPGTWDRAEFQVSIQGKNVTFLEALFGVNFSVRRPFELSANFTSEGNRISLTNLTGYVNADKATNVLTIKQGEFFAGGSNPVKISLEGVLNDQSLTVELEGDSLTALASGSKAGPFKIEARAVDALFAADGTMTWVAGAPAIELKATIEGDRAASLNGLLGTSLPDLGPYRFSAILRKSDETYQVSGLNGRIGASDFAGELQWSQTKERPTLKGKIASQSLHVKELFASPKGNSGNQAKPNFLDRSIQLDWLTAIDVELNINVRRVMDSPLSVDNTAATVKLDNGRLTVSPLQAKLAGSPITGDLSIVLGKDAPTIKLNANSTGLDLGKVLEELEASRKIRGRVGNLRFALASRGRTLRALIRRVDLSLKNGAGTIYYGEDKVEEIKIAAAEIEVKEAQPIRLSVEGKIRATRLALDVQSVALEAFASETSPWPLGISLKVPQASLKAHGSVTHPFQGRGFDLAYEIAGKNLKELGPVTDLLLPLSGAYRLTGRFTDEPDRYLLNDMEIKVGQSDIGGSIVIVTGEPHPKISVKMNSRTVRYDDLEFVTGVDEDKIEDGLVIPEYVIPVEALLAVDVDIHLEIERIRMRRENLGELLLKATLENGRLVKSTRYSSSVTGARISFKHEAEFATDPPVHSIHLSALGLDYGLLLTEAEATDVAEGRVDIEIELAGAGATKRSFLSQANGNITITGGSGRIGSLALRLWSAGLTDLTTKMLSAGWRREPVAELNCIAGRFKVENGLAETDKLLLDTDRLTVAGSGAIDLGTEELDLLLSPNPKEQRFLSFANPVRVTGTLASPKVTITRLPRVRALAPVGRLSNLVNPVYLLSAFTEVDSGEDNPCVAAIEKRDSEPNDEQQRRNILRRFRRLF